MIYHLFHHLDNHNMNIVVFVTAKNQAEAKKIAKGLIKEKLAACVKIAGGVDSLFRWQGKIDSAKETLLIINSKKVLFNKIIRKVNKVN